MLDLLDFSLVIKHVDFVFREVDLCRWRTQTARLTVLLLVLIAPLDLGQHMIYHARCSRAMKLWTS